MYLKMGVMTWVRLDEKTGKVLNDNLSLSGFGGGASSSGTQLVPGPDGNLYAWGYADMLKLFTHEGKPLNWPGQNSNNITLRMPMSFQGRHLSVTAPDNIWVVPRPDAKFDADLIYPCVNLLGADGQVKRTVVWQCTQAAVIRADANGNVYLADSVKPAGRNWPEFFDGKLAPPPTSSGDTRNSVFAYSYMYGSIIKFPPSGGAIWYDSKISDKAKEAIRTGKAGGAIWEDTKLSNLAKGQPGPEVTGKPKIKITHHLGSQYQIPASCRGRSGSGSATHPSR
jgi:hypothetical protein